MGVEAPAGAYWHQIGVLQIALRLIYRIRDINITRDADAIAPRRVARVGSIQIRLHHPADLLGRVGPRQQRKKSFLRRDLQRAVATRTSDADIGPRAGQRLGDDLPILALPNLTVPIEGLGRFPSLQDDVDRLAHHVALRRGQLAAQAAAIADTEAEPGHIA